MLKRSFIKQKVLGIVPPKTTGKNTRRVAVAASRATRSEGQRLRPERAHKRDCFVGCSFVQGGDVVFGRLGIDRDLVV